MFRKVKVGDQILQHGNMAAEVDTIVSVVEDMKAVEWGHKSSLNRSNIQVHVRILNIKIKKFCASLCMST